MRTQKGFSFPIFLLLTQTVLVAAFAFLSIACIKTLKFSKPTDVPSLALAQAPAPAFPALEASTIRDGIQGSYSMDDLKSLRTALPAKLAAVPIESLENSLDENEVLVDNDVNSLKSLLRGKMGEVGSSSN